MEIACLIPARGGSKRFPRKNLAPFKGRAVLTYPIKAAHASNCFPRVWVSTEDPEIAETARSAGAEVHPRTDALAGDRATVVEVCLDFHGWLRRRGEEPEALCVILPTAVLLTPEDLRRGVERFRQGDNDFVIAVTRCLESPFIALQERGGRLEPRFGREFLKPGRRLDPLWVDAGAFYFANVEALRREKSFYGRRLAGVSIPRDRSVDIDEPVHLNVAEALFDFRRRRAEVGGAA